MGCVVDYVLQGLREARVVVGRKWFATGRLAVANGGLVSATRWCCTMLAHEGAALGGGVWAGIGV
jgi:hypothetical protein